jgi:hypothetical protein
MMRKPLRCWGRYIILVCLLLLAGCSGSGSDSSGGGGNRADSALVRVQIGASPGGQRQATQGLTTGVTRQRLGGIPAEVVAVTLRVTANGSAIADSPLTIPLETGTVSVTIPANTASVFTVEATNLRGDIIFDGSDTVTLPPGGTSDLSITLMAQEVIRVVITQIVEQDTGGEMTVDESQSPVLGLRLTVPSNTLPETTTISVSEAYNPQSVPVLVNQASIIVDLLPSGITFTTPVTLTFPYDPALVQALGFEPSSLALQRFNPTLNQWVTVPGQRLDEANHAVIARLSSFSFYAIAGGFPSRPTNSAPVADAQALTTAENTTQEIRLTGSDADEDPLTFRIVTGPSHGTLSGNLPSLTYTPETHFTGDDTFTFVANDGLEDSAPATVTITLTPINDPPSVLTPIADVRVDDNAPATQTTLDLSTTFTDVDVATSGDVLTLSVANNTNPGLVTTTLTGPTLTLLYAPNQNGSAVFTVRATDQGGLFIETTFQVTIERIFPFTLNISRLNDASQRLQPQVD